MKINTNSSTLDNIPKTDEHGCCCAYITGDSDKIILSCGTAQCGKNKRNKIPSYLLPENFLPICTSREAEFWTTYILALITGFLLYEKKKKAFQEKERKGRGQHKEPEKSFSS